MICFFVISTALTLYYFYKVINEPLHPDSAEFIYPGMIQRKGNSKVYLQKKVDNKYKPASLSYDAFPPPPFSNISNEKNYIGAFPAFRDKMFVWWFFEKLYKYFPLKPRQFRIVNSALILILANMFYFALSHSINFYHAILWAMIFQFTIMLPHFDFYQIHAEEWGLLLLLAAFILISIESSALWPAVVFGILLVFLFIFIKITFAPTLLYFLLAPLFIYEKMQFFQISILTIIFFSLYLMVTWLFTGRIKPVFWSINPFHLVKYRKGSSTSMSEEQRESSFSLQHFLKYYKLELLAGILFFLPTIQWFLSKETPAKAEIFMFGWLCVIFIEIIIQGKLYPSHLLPLTVPGIFFIALQEGIFQPMIAVIIFIIWAKYFIYNKKTLLETYGIQSQNPFVKLILDYDEVAECVAAKTEENDRILTIGYASPVYVLSNRRAALGLYEGLTTLEPIDISKKLGAHWEWWLLKAMIEEKPKLVIDSSRFLNVPEFSRAIGVELGKIKSVGKFDIYAADYSKSFTNPANLGAAIFNTNQRR